MASATSQLRLSPRFRSVGAALAISGVIFGASVGPGSAATEVSRTPFSKFGSQNCPDSGSCSVDFGIVPGAIRVRYEITHVTCYLSIANANGRVGYWYLHVLKSGTILGRIHMRPNFLGTFTTSVTYNANEEGLVVAPGGSSMIVTMTRDSSTAGGIPNMDCTISGYDVRLQ
jgi:hypothetical protein